MARPQPCPAVEFVRRRAAQTGTEAGLPRKPGDSHAKPENFDYSKR